ncbi:uncharacterized protein EI97DRAFT_102740 [Westerdykella ornata]|uniref:Uncharacterized protein n=1 Tax=Westerdykella ornata TaxID=318751 RepID=A0A6A6JEC6_WESOR|nr:uncharacterized protein EI97DRAFT_102740 [Westerdykella ornata]KAF2274574.1 hypothetical protein EI97DRAFT_102740 [Westerdykella ornata]
MPVVRLRLIGTSLLHPYLEYIQEFPNHIGNPTLNERTSLTTVLLSTPSPLLPLVLYRVTHLLQPPRPLRLHLSHPLNLRLPLRPPRVRVQPRTELVQFPPPRQDNEQDHQSQQDGKTEGNGYGIERRLRFRRRLGHEKGFCGRGSGDGGVEGACCRVLLEVEGEGEGGFRGVRGVCHCVRRWVWVLVV